MALTKPLVLSRETVAFGTFVKTDSPLIVELLGTAALDFAVVDAEHGPFDRVAIDRMLLAGRAADLPLLVRVPDKTATAIQGPLDMGAAGIVVPHVDSAEQAAEVVSFAKFRDGHRGFSISPRFAGYSTLPRTEVLARGDAARVICQIESTQALEAVDAIAAVPGVDALFIGRADLALSMGMADFHAPEVDTAIRRIAAAARAAGKVCGMYVPDIADAEQFFEAGVSWFVVSSDQGLVQIGARALMQTGRRLAMPAGEPADGEAPARVPDRQQQLMIRLELEALNAEFAYRVDHGPATSAADLFTEQGSYGRQGGPCSKGREAIRQTYALRDAHGVRTARHVFTNLRLVFDSADRVRGTTLQTLFAQDGLPPLPARVLAVSDFDDVYVRGADGRWFYESRTITSVFVDESGRKPVLPFAASP